MSGKIDIPAFFVRCPYCGHKNRIRPKDQYYSESVCCEVEDGGCEQYFFVKTVTRVEAMATVHKIEGYATTDPAHDAEGGAA